MVFLPKTSRQQGSPPLCPRTSSKAGITFQLGRGPPWLSTHHAWLTQRGGQQGETLSVKKTLWCFSRQKGTLSTKGAVVSSYSRRATARFQRRGSRHLGKVKESPSHKIRDFHLHRVPHAVGCREVTLPSEGSTAYGKTSLGRDPPSWN